MLELLCNQLRKQRNQRKLTQEEVARKIGVARTTYAMYEQDSREPNYETLQKLADLFEVSVDWLLGRNDLPPNIEPYDPSKVLRIPILGTIRAGEPIDRIEQVKGYELVEPEVLRGRQGFVLRVKGDSMIGDRIYEGDRVVVVKQEEVLPSDIAVVAVNGDEATLKRVKCEGGICMLYPSNPKMEPIIAESKEVYVIGKVVQARHDLE